MILIWLTVPIICVLILLNFKPSSNVERLYSDIIKKDTFVSEIGESYNNLYNNIPFLNYDTSYWGTWRSGIQQGIENPIKGVGPSGMICPPTSPVPPPYGNIGTFASAAASIKRLTSVTVSGRASQAFCPAQRPLGSSRYLGKAGQSMRSGRV